MNSGAGMARARHDKENPMKKKNRKNITLIEIIIVMFFITIITGIVAYNIKGALDEGKAFRTGEGIKQIENILSMELANGNLSPEDLRGDTWKESIKGHPLVKNWKTLLKDGWGGEYEVVYDDETGELTVKSEKFEAYKTAHPSTMFADKKE